MVLGHMCNHLFANAANYTYLNEIIIFLEYLTVLI